MLDRSKRRMGAVVLASCALVAGLLLATWATVSMSRPDSTGAVPGVTASTTSPRGVSLPAPIALPSPHRSGGTSLEEALARRRSVRSFTGAPLDRSEIGQLLWAAQGITGPDGRRTAPSAGALYPLELYAITSAGVSRYLPSTHALQPVRSGDQRSALQAAALGQEAVGEAPLVVVITAVPSRTASKYGPGRGARYVQLEAGHAAQNLLLQAVTLDLGAVPIGAFDDGSVRSVLGLPEGEVPLYLLAIGHPAP